MHPCLVSIDTTTVPSSFSFVLTSLCLKREKMHKSLMVAISRASQIINRTLQLEDITPGSQRSSILSQMVFKPLGENRCERWNSKCVLDLCNDIVCSCRVHERIYETSCCLDLIAAPETSIDPDQPQHVQDTGFNAFCQSIEKRKPHSWRGRESELDCGHRG